MASDSRLVSDINEQFLICKICFEVLRTPKTLGCLHTFCADCLDKHLDAESDRQSYRFTAYSRALSCPICRKKTEVPAGGVRRLPDNFLVASLAEIVGRKQLLSGGTGGCGSCAEGPPCDICKSANARDASGKPAVARCLDCAKLLCRHCVDLHRRTKVTQAHSVFDLDIMNKDIACKAHVDEVVRYYCESCEVCICVVCTFHEHKTHNVYSFGDSLDRCTRILQPLVNRSRERVDEARRQLDAIEKCEKEIKAVEEHVRDYIIESMADIRRQERHLIQSIADAYGEEGAKFIRDKDYLQEVIEGLSDAQAVADMLIREQSVELLFVRRDVEEKLKVFLQRRLRQVPEEINYPIKFVPRSLRIGHLKGDDSVQQKLISEALGDLLVTEAVQTNSGYTSDQVSMTTLSFFNCVTVETQTVANRQQTFAPLSKRYDESSDTEAMSSSAYSLESGEESASIVSSRSLTPSSNSGTPVDEAAKSPTGSCTPVEAVTSAVNFGEVARSLEEGSKLNVLDKPCSNVTDSTHTPTESAKSDVIKIIFNNEIVGCLNVPCGYFRDKFNISLNVFNLEDLTFTYNKAEATANGLSTCQSQQQQTDRSVSSISELSSNFDVGLNSDLTTKQHAAFSSTNNRDAETVTDKTQASDKSCSPIRIMRPNIGVMASCTMADKSNQSLVDTADAEIDVRASTAEQGTGTPQVTVMNRETCMPAVHVMHKNLGTDSQEMCDKQTSTVDVTAGYKEAVSKKGVICVNRGTNTSLVVTCHRETSPPPVNWTCVDRASSPVKLVTMVDKGVSAKKGEILEPVDVFSSPGKLAKTVDGIKRSATNSPRSPKPPKLESIQEDSSIEQQALAEECPLRPMPAILRNCRNSLPFISGHHYTHGNALSRSPRRISDPLGKAYEEGNAQARLLFGKQDDRVFFPPSFDIGDTKSVRLRCRPSISSTVSTLSEDKRDDECQTSFILMPPPAAVAKPVMVDKAVSTDSLPIEGKMAACINKLKTVQQRLEQQPLTSPQLASSMSHLTPDRCSDSLERCSGDADVVLTKTVGDLARENPQVFSLVSPITMRRFPLALRPHDVMSDSSDSEKMTTSTGPAGSRSPRVPPSRRRISKNLPNLAEFGGSDPIVASSMTGSSTPSMGQSYSSAVSEQQPKRTTTSKDSPKMNRSAHVDGQSQQQQQRTKTSQNQGQNAGAIANSKSPPTEKRGVKDTLSPERGKTAADRPRKLSPFRRGNNKSPTASPAPTRKNRLGLASRLFSAATGKGSPSEEKLSTKAEDQPKSGILKKFYKS